MGSLLGVLSVTHTVLDGMDLPTYQWTPPDPLASRRTIGVERRAREVLFNEEQLREDILREVSVRVEQVHRDQLAVEFLALILHANKEIYPVRQVATPGGAMKPQAEVENDVLSRYGGSVRGIAGDSITSQALELLSSGRLDDFSAEIGDGKKRALRVFVEGAE